MMHLTKILFLFLFFSFVSCGEAETEPDTDMGAIAPDAEVRSDLEVDLVDMKAPVDMQEPNLCPREGEMVCDGKCENVQISMNHCGTCFNACIIGRMTCNGTACVCLAGKDLCDNDCWDLQTTKAHCGSCGKSCTDGQACVDGGCIEISDREEVVGILAATNVGRAKQQDCGIHGIKNAVGVVQLNAQLMLAAQKHSEDMAMNNFMEHKGSDGSSPFERARSKNYTGSAMGENIARGYRTPERTVDAWIESDGHCQNMMNGSYTELGVGFAIGPVTGEFFWTQLFGHP